MTCNPTWKEITDNLMHGEKADDRPDLVSRAFRAKLEELKDDIVKKNYLARLQHTFTPLNIRNVDSLMHTG